MCAPWRVEDQPLETLDTQLRGHDWEGSPSLNWTSGESCGSKATVKTVKERIQIFGELALEGGRGPGVREV